MLCKKPFNGYGCLQCTPCRINLKRLWQTRIMLEAQLHGDTGMLTLTYSEETVPINGMSLQTLDPVDLRNFWKRLRKSLPPRSLRYYAVGEYGDDSFRPHYHAALFGFGCLGKSQRPETGLECHCSHCQLVKRAWGLGNITIDELNDTTAAYVAGYVLKKMTRHTDPRLEGRFPEFARQSTGIARGVVDDIVDVLTSEYGYLAGQHGDIPHTLMIGGKSIPLGRYLRTKIRERLGLEKHNPETGEVTYGAPHETLKILKALSQGPEMQALFSDIKNLETENKLSLYAKVDTLREKNALKMQQRIKNLEAKHSIRQSTKGKSL